MLTSYSVACPHPKCDWTGSLVPSHLRGGADAEIVSMHRAWFQCPRCRCDWEVRITDDKVTILPVDEHGSGTGANNGSVPIPTARQASG